MTKHEAISNALAIVHAELSASALKHKMLAEHIARTTLEPMVPFRLGEYERHKNMAEAYEIAARRMWPEPVDMDSITVPVGGGAP